MCQKIAIIGCGKRKRKTSCEASQMYTGSLFRLTLKYCKLKKYNKILIISAKYGLLSLTDIIHPYNKEITDLSKQEHKKWILKVNYKIKQYEKNKIHFYCSIKYSSFFNGKNILKGMVIGKRMKFLKDKIQTLEKKGFNLK